MLVLKSWNCCPMKKGSQVAFTPNGAPAPDGAHDASFQGLFGSAKVWLPEVPSSVTVLAGWPPVWL
jgi:hypothetical protein